MEADLAYWTNAADLIPALDKMLEELCWQWQHETVESLVQERTHYSCLVIVCRHQRMDKYRTIHAESGIRNQYSGVPN